VAAGAGAGADVGCADDAREAPPEPPAREVEADDVSVPSDDASRWRRVRTVALSARTRASCVASCRRRSRSGVAVAVTSPDAAADVAVDGAWPDVQATVAANTAATGGAITATTGRRTEMRVGLALVMRLLLLDGQCSLCVDARLLHGDDAPGRRG
jgi:hypothetical protein